MTYSLLPRRGLFPVLAVIPAALALSLPGCTSHDIEPEGLTLSGNSPASRSALSPEEARTVEIVRNAGPSVAAIHVTMGGVQAHPLMPPGEQQAGGSGFVIDDDGRIITNFHVISGALEGRTLQTSPDASITVSFLDEPDREFPVRVRGGNPDFDLALLELIDPEAAETPAPLTLGDSDLIAPGQNTIAIGSPFGLHSTVTTGIVSAVERDRPGLVGLEIPFIQTDAAINPGNSGGPLLSSRGEVIGINNAILAAPMGPQAFIGVGFAVPSNLLRESLDALLAGGLSGVAAALDEIPDRPRLGLSAALTVEEYPPPLRTEVELPDHGVVVTEVSPGGPADRAGLVPPTETVVLGGQAFPLGGDIIVEVEGQPVRRLIDLQRVILEREAGDAVELTIWRDGEERTVPITLEVVAP